MFQALNAIAYLGSSDLPASPASMWRARFEYYTTYIITIFFEPFRVAWMFSTISC